MFIMGEIGRSFRSAIGYDFGNSGPAPPNNNSHTGDVRSAICEQLRVCPLLH